MTWGIIIIALGDTLYGNMACVLAASIKKNCKLPVCVVHTEGSLKQLTERQLDLFDIKILCPRKYYKHKRKTEYQMAKVYLYDLSPFDETIFLDADSIICPSRNPEDWFEHLKDENLAFYVNEIYDFTAPKEHEYRKDYLWWWTDVKKYKDYYGFTDQKIPQTNSSFIYFKKNFETKVFFWLAQKVYGDDATPVMKWNNGKPDEYCFNTAYGQYDNKEAIMPRRVPYKPMHLWILNSEHNPYYILEYHIAMSVVGHKVPADMVQVYNDWMEYYFDYFGFRKKFFHRHKTRVIHTRYDW